MGQFSKRLTKKQKDRLPALRTMDRRSLRASRKAENQMVDATIPLVFAYEKLVRKAFDRLLEQWKKGRMDAKFIASGDIGAWLTSVLADISSIPTSRFEALAAKALRAIDRNMNRQLELEGPVGLTFSSGRVAAFYEVERRNALESIEAMFADDVQKLAGALEGLRGLPARGQAKKMVERLGTSVLTKKQQEEFAGVALPKDEAGIVINDLRKLRSEPERKLLRTARQRAELLARDQVLSANAGASRLKLQEAGASKYVWITSLDERVRENHAELHGTTQNFNDPPIGGGTGPDDPGNPGEGIQCRCTAYPIFEELEGEFA